MGRQPHKSKKTQNQNPHECDPILCFIFSLDYHGLTSEKERDDHTPRRRRRLRSDTKRQRQLAPSLPPPATIFTDLPKQRLRQSFPSRPRKGIRAPLSDLVTTATTPPRMLFIPAPALFFSSFECYCTKGPHQAITHPPHQPRSKVVVSNDPALVHEFIENVFLP